MAKKLMHLMIIGGAITFIAASVCISQSKKVELDLKGPTECTRTLGETRSRDVVCRAFWRDGALPVVLFVTTRTVTPHVGRYSGDVHSELDRLVILYGRFTCTLDPGRLPVENPNIGSQPAYGSSGGGYVEIFSKRDLLVLRILGADGGGSNVGVVVIHEGRVLNSITMGLEEYRKKLRKGTDFLSEQEETGIAALVESLVGETR